MKRQVWLFFVLALAVVLLLDAVPAGAQAAGPYEFYAIAPCRIVDTRSGLGGFTGLFYNGDARNFTIKGAAPCSIPTDARAVAFNVTIADATRQGWAALFPAATAYGGISTLNFFAGENIANGAIVPVTLGAPDLTVLFAFEPGSPVGSANLILDVTGYFR